MEQELPKIDITEDFVIGSNADIDLNILNLYKYHPDKQNRRRSKTLFHGIFF